MQLIQRITRMMAREASLPESLREVVKLVEEHLACDSCLLYLLDGNELVLCAASPPHSGAVGEVRLRLDEGLTGWVARERRLLSISRKAFEDSRFKFFRDLPEDTYEAFLSAPVIVRNHVAGVINVQHRSPHSHSGGEIELLSTIGELMGALLVLTQLKPHFIERSNHAELALSDTLAGSSGN